LGPPNTKACAHLTCLALASQVVQADQAAEEGSQAALEGTCRATRGSRAWVVQA